MTTEKKRVIITPCGTSLFKSKCWHTIIEKKDPKNALEKLKYDLTREETLKQIGLEPDIDLSQYFSIKAWNTDELRTDLPAELASLKAISLVLGLGKTRPLNSQDKIILIHSNSGEGLFCGKQIKNIIEKKKLLLNVQIENWPIPQMDPKNAQYFGKALQDIWHKLAEEFNNGDEEEYLLNITGGYKGLICILGAFAYSQPNTKIYYMYEETCYDEVLEGCFDSNDTIKGLTSEFKFKPIPVRNESEGSNTSDAGGPF